jgi:hypothetical protein
VAAPNTVAEWLGRNGAAVPITIVLRNIVWTPAAGGVVAVTGGVDFDGDGNADSYAAADASATATNTIAPTNMWWSSSTDGTNTVLRLYNSPLKTPCAKQTIACDKGGLDPSRQLYSLEYIPSPVENLPDATSPAAFTTNLATAGTGVKNTARWILTIPSGVLPKNAMITVETHLGDELAAGTYAPENVSRTYAWRGTDQWIFGDAANDGNLPLTERFQFLGDPRHCPYADLKLPHNGSTLARQDALGMGYNRYFDDFHGGSNEGATWPGWSYTAGLGGAWYGIKNNAADIDPSNDGWNSGSGLLEVDVSRIYQVLRSAVVRSHAVYTTMTGFSYYYVGMGGEIGYDSANGFPNSIPVSTKPFTGVGGTRNEQSITTDFAGGVKYVRENVAGNYWWGMSWLGELAPDSAWKDWKDTGNLPAGSGAGRFVRVLRGAITTRLPAGTTLLNAVRRTQEEGCTTFFWSGKPSSTFHHSPADNTFANRVAGGNDIANTYKMTLPDTIANSRPFDIDLNIPGANPDHFLQNAYGAPTTLETLTEFYRHDTNIHGSALLALRDNNNDAAFVVVNGLSPTGESGVAFIARWSFLSLIQSFMESGRYSSGGKLDPARVRELPRVAITYPNDDVDIEKPTALNVTWDMQWKRWDGLPYTPSYPVNFSEDTTVRYALLYSRDNGRTWLFMKDDQPATAGTRPAAGYLQTATSFNWSVPESLFPKGNYVIRVEAYRDDMPLHYSFHQYRAFFKR